MKKIISYLLIFVMMIGALSGCSSSTLQEDESKRVEQEIPTKPETQGTDVQEEKGTAEQVTRPPVEDVENAYFELLSSKSFLNTDMLLHHLDLYLTESRTGPFAANVMDLDGDGIQEMLLLSTDHLDQYGGSLTLEVYGYVNGKVTRYNEITEEFYSGDMLSFKLFQKEGRTYIGSYSRAAGSGSPPIYSYYELKDQKLVLKEKLMCYSDWVDSENGSQQVMLYFRSTDADALQAGAEISMQYAVTEKEFEQIMSSYQEYETIVEFQDSFSVSEQWITNKLMSKLVESVGNDSYQIAVNGTPLTVKADPLEVNGELLLPMESIFSNLGIGVVMTDWSVAMSLDENHAGADNVLIASTKADIVIFGVFKGPDTNSLHEIYGEKTGSHAVISGVSYISPEVLSATFPVTVDIDKNAKTVKITSQIAKTDYADAHYINSMFTFNWEDAVRILGENGYVFQGVSHSYYGKGGLWISCVVYDPNASAEAIASGNAEVGFIEVAHNGRLSTYEHFGRLEDMWL